MLHLRSSLSSPKEEASQGRPPVGTLIIIYKCFANRRTSSEKLSLDRSLRVILDKAYLDGNRGASCAMFSACRYVSVGL